MTASRQAASAAPNQRTEASETLTGARIIVEALVREGVDIVFGYPGGAILPTYDALYDALRSGHLRGAALDTFTPEPPPADMPLLQLPNVTLSPHIAGASRFSATKAATMIAEDVARFLAGDRPHHLCP